MVHRYFLLYLPPRPLGTHPLRLPRYRGRATSNGGGELRYSIYLILALLLSGIGGIMGGYIMYFIKKGNYNPVIGIAAVSCVPTTAKVAQKLVSKDNPDSFILGDALGANISGVITSAIITGIYITIIPYLLRGEGKLNREQLVHFYRVMS